MHVALVNRWYPPHTGFGGVAMYNYFLAAALTEKGHRVSIVAARWSPTVPPVEQCDRIHVRRLLVKHRPWLHRLPLAGRHMRSVVLASYSRQVMHALRDLESKDRPDVVEFADIEAEGYAYLRQKRRCPVIVRCHTPMFVLHRYYRAEEWPGSTSRIQAREKLCISQADALTAPSRNMAETIADECNVSRERIAVIPNALDVRPFERAGSESSSQRNGGSDVVILHVGRLDRGKGIEVLAEAIPSVLEQIPEARFVFAGDGRLPTGSGTWRTRLEEKLSAQQKSGRVTFLGELSLSALADWYGRVDIAVVPSLIYESFSYTCAQAAAAGLPVVASRIGGIPETIEDGVAGILVEPGNVEQLLSALLRLAREPILRRQMGAAGQRKAARSFAASEVAEQTLEIYRSAVAHRLNGGHSVC